MPGVPGSRAVNVLQLMPALLARPATDQPRRMRAIRGLLFTRYAFFFEEGLNLLLLLGLGFLGYSAAVFLANRRAYGSANQT